MTEQPSRGLRECAFTVLYDGECPICLGWIKRLQRWDKRAVLNFIPARDQRARDRFPWIPLSALEDSLHLVGPQRETWQGAAAVEQLMRLLPGWRFGAWLFRFPWARPMADRAYKWVARNRYLLSCGLHCRITKDEGGDA